MTRKFSGEQLVIATHNQGKLEEIRHLFEPFKINIIGANQLNITEPEETEDSFVGNARIKAHFSAKMSNYEFNRDHIWFFLNPYECIRYYILCFMHSDSLKPISSAS